MNATESSGRTPAAGARARAGWKGALGLLALAAALELVANGRHTIAAAAWLAPVFLLRFVRARRARRGLFMAWLVLAGTWAFQFRDMAPLPQPWYSVLAAVYGLLETVPFALDRILVPRVRGFAATLILPASWVAMEYLVATFTPYGSWGSIAYTQHEHLALLQVMSVTGLYGVSFLIMWFASTLNWAWERSFSWPAVRRGTIAFAGVVAIVLVGGGARLALLPPGAATVRVASLTKPDVELFPSVEVAQRAYAGALTDEEVAALERRAAAIDDDLLRRSDREARAGAKIVFWGEANAFTFKPDEPSLLGRAADLARARGIYLGVAVGTWNPAGSKPLENKLVLFDPNGKAVMESWKARPVPGSEAAISARDDGLLESIETRYGRLGAAICFDMDFPDLLAEAGAQGVDLMLAPSNDWRAIDPWHSHMARFRAIEQGFNLVRHTSNGLSLAADYQGRVVASMDHFAGGGDRVLVSAVPTRGARTLYSRIGDLFAWLCSAAVLLFAGLAWKGR